MLCVMSPLCNLPSSSPAWLTYLPHEGVVLLGQGCTKHLGAHPFKGGGFVLQTPKLAVCTDPLSLSGQESGARDLALDHLHRTHTHLEDCSPAERFD